MDFWLQNFRHPLGGIKRKVRQHWPIFFHDSNLLKPSGICLLKMGVVGTTVCCCSSCPAPVASESLTPWVKIIRLNIIHNLRNFNRFL